MRPSIAIIYCKSLENQIKTITQGVPQVTHLESLKWALHVNPDMLLETLTDRILSLQDNFDAIMLGYGRCQALDRLPKFKIPIFYPQVEDCIALLMGPERYSLELNKKPKTWFLTPGWTRMGVESVFHELQINDFADKGLSPLQVAKKMLVDYNRALFIDMEDEKDNEGLLKKANHIASDLSLKLEKTNGSLGLLRETLERALSCIDRT